MNYIISESQSDNITEKFIRFKKKTNMFSALKAFSIPGIFLDKILNKKIFESMTCSDFNDFYLFYHSKRQIKRDYKDENYEIKTEVEMGGSINYVIIDLHTTHKIEGYASPYFDGTCELPIETTLFIPYSNYFDEFEIQEFDTFNLSGKFENFSELLSFFNKEYFQILINFNLPFFSVYGQ